jgi:hypothetical protein
MSIPINRRTVLAAAMAVTLVVAIAPLAVSRADSLARVDVYDRSAGEALSVYRHHGRRYVEGQPGNEYAVRIRNCTDQRLLAVLSVDGVNVVTGETASPDQSGYVIEPGGYVTVQGWRKDLNRTAAFYFSDLGVIGVALFRERPLERQGWLSSDRRTAPAPSREKAEADAAGKTVDSRAASANAAAPAMQEPSLGTGHGRGEYSPVQQVEFERASTRPDELVAIRYERRETLVAMGVLPVTRHGLRDPDPFPGALSFVPDP